MTDEDEKINEKKAKSIFSGMIAVFVITVCAMIFFFYYQATEPQKELREKQKAIERMETEIKYEIMTEYLNEK